MGMGMEGVIVAQLKKAQGETNQRIDALLTEQRRTNDLLAQLVCALSDEAPVPAPQHQFGTSEALPHPKAEPGKQYWQPFGKKK